MKDGSRNFADLPEIVCFDTLRSHARKLAGVSEIGFLTDWVTEVWLDLEYRGHRFSINNQMGNYWFFVENPLCPDDVLLEVVNHFEIVNPVSRKLAFFGGTFDPVHGGHLKIAKRLVDLFQLDEFLFLPAFHAPHKAVSKPTSGYHRFAMLSLATADEPRIAVSTLELDHAESRYSFDTLTELISLNRNDRVLFVMGGDSWRDIKTWHRWEEVLLLTDIIVVSRPGYTISFDHVTETVRARIEDVRGNADRVPLWKSPAIFITDAVHFDVSSTEIRNDIRDDDVLDRTDDVPEVVAKYIEKYELYR
jgi:nicotinate-nucleotide adenylyltransferase